VSSASPVTISQEAAIARIERAISIRLYFPAALEQAAGTPSTEEAALRAAEGHDCSLSVAVAACARMSARRFLVDDTLVIYPYDGDETRCVVRSDGPS